jgi:hypothetical protein
VAQQRHLLEGFVEIVQVVDFKPVQAVLLNEVRDVLGDQQGVLPIQMLQEVLLGEGSIDQFAFGLAFLGLVGGSLPLDQLHHQVQPGRDELVSIAGRL